MVRGWGKWAEKKYGTCACPKASDPKQYVMLVRDFLHVRPLAYEIDDWMVYWIKKRDYLNKKPNKGRGL
jgi:hypothetical protein